MRDPNRTPFKVGEGVTTPSGRAVKVLAVYPVEGGYEYLVGGLDYGVYTDRVEEDFLRYSVHPKHYHRWGRTPFLWEV